MQYSSSDISPQKNSGGDGRLISKKLSLLDNEVYVDQQVPFGVLTSIRFKVLSEEDVEKASVKEIVVANEVTDLH
ncbi:hypothetical protein L2E82_41522 [Cichorium intybus]|uniref:Uncharacterized protein n=1 Tax=Cichorium intybus TaxID=13427 RepID=A0ACB9ANL1_CICIN|nr:hypothetical protein L2E82_41522 [Cichorium intybus]